MGAARRCCWVFVVAACAKGSSADVPVVDAPAPDCAEMRGGADWNDGDCGDGQRFVCER